MKKIGIISGMGAAAGARFYDMLIKEYQKNGAIKDSDFPEILLHNIPSRGMNELGIANAEVVKLELASSVSVMNRLGIEEIVIACNTVHVYHEWLQENSKAKILNMVDIAIEKIVPYQKVGVISSNTTKSALLYLDKLNSVGIEVMQTTITQQEIVDDVIGKAIAGTDKYSDREKIESIVNLMLRECDKVILGCTELPLIVRSSDRIVDAGEEVIKRMAA